MKVWSRSALCRFEISQIIMETEGSRSVQINLITLFQTRKQDWFSKIANSYLSNSNTSS